MSFKFKYKRIRLCGIHVFAWKYVSDKITNSQFFYIIYGRHLICHLIV